VRKEPKFGLKLLTKKTIITIAASIAALTNQSAKADPAPININTDLNPNLSFKFKKKSQFVLKLNPKNIEKSVAVNHTSHSSHASHSSHTSYSPPPGHSSHSSHSSHVSSSPSYYPSHRKVIIPSVPTPKKSTYHPKATPKQDSHKNTTIKKFLTPEIDSLGTRILFRGCAGRDVAQLQRILEKLGFTISLVEGKSSYFGDYTDLAVRYFQLQNGLKVDGIVGKNTLIIIKRKFHENRN